MLTFYYDDQKAARGGMDIGGGTKRPWSEALVSITSVVFDASFANYTSLSSTRHWFFECSNLTSISGINNLKTENVTDMEAMFYGCSSLTSLDLSGFNTANVTDMDMMFFDCKSLTNLNLSGFNTQNVTDMSSMFSGCNSLTSLDLSGFNTQNVTSMSSMFWGCNLTNLDLSGFNTENVTNMGGMFGNCSALTSLDLSGFNTQNVTDMSGMFHSCSSLTNLDLSGFNTENVTDMSDMFNMCSSLTSLDISGFNTKHVTNMQLLFGNCSALTSLDLSKFNTENVYNMFGLFAGCSGLTSLDLSGFNTSQVESMEGMFSECSALTSLDLSKFNTEKVTSMNEMFYVCSGLTSLDLSGFNTSNVTDMYYMFASCDGLTSLDVSGFNTENVKNMEYMFQGCASLKSLDLSSFNTSNVNGMAWMFDNCFQLTTIIVGQEWTTEHSAGSGMFLNCNNLVGGAGTKYDENHTDHTYAHIDGGTSNPGYLTGINGGGEASEEAWNELHEAVDRGDKLLTEAREAGTVEQWALEELENMTVKGSLMYEEHTAGEEEVRHMTEELNHIIWEVEEMMHHDPQSEAYFQNYTAYVYGDATLDDAFAVVGREAAVKTIAAIVWESNNELTSDQLQGITNPNLLVYVNDASIVPDSIQNVIVNGTAEEIILTDATGNNNFYCPQSFTAKSISYSRDFSQTTELEVCRGWETIALPFDVQNITHESHGALVPFAGGNSGYHFWLRQLSENGLMSAAQIEANKPYLISMPNNSIYPSVYNQNGKVTFSASDVTVPETMPQSDSYAGVTLYATFQQVAQGSSVYALNVGEARGEYPEGSVFEQNYRDIRPFQAYTTHTAGTRGIITLESLGGNDNTTGIEEIRMNSELRDSKGPWYSLDGRRLDAEPTKKGIYVKDGRKIVIK